jgi:hypothetical protein
MRGHPYRSRPTPEEDAATDGLEERAVAFVLMVAGAVGFAIGWSAPNANATEFVLGIGLLAIGIGTYVRSLSERRAPPMV